MPARSGGGERRGVRPACVTCSMRAAVVAWSLIGLAGVAWGGPPVSGTSDERAQQDARRQIDQLARTNKLSADARRKADAVLSSVTLYRRLPTQVIRCDPDLYHFMTTRPDVTVNLWQVLDLSNIRLTRTGETTFHADDSAGTVLAPVIAVRSAPRNTWSRLVEKSHTKRRASARSM